LDPIRRSLIGATDYGGYVTITRGLNSPNEVFFFTKTPEQYLFPSNYYDYRIREATQETMARAKADTRSSTKLEIIDFNQPKVDVQGQKYIYVVRSNASRDNFAKVMSPESVRMRKVPGIGIPGLHYSAGETYGDAIGLTIEAATPEAAKRQWQEWYNKICAALKALSERFEQLNNQMDSKIEELAAIRLEELNRAKNAL
jgi:hypothetical protein